MKLNIYFLIIIYFAKLTSERDTPPTLEEIANDPNSTLDEMSYYNNRPNMIQEDNEQAQLLMKEFGFDKDVEIKKYQLKQFVFRLITMDESLPKQEKDFYDKVVDSFTDTVPESFSSKDIKKFLSTEEFNETVKSVIIELYGEETYKQFDNFEITPEHLNKTTNNQSINPNSLDGVNFGDDNQRIDNHTIKKTIKHEEL